MPSTRSIGFLIFEDFQLLDTAGPVSAFEVAGDIVRHTAGSEAYRLHVLAEADGPVRSSSGAILQATGIAQAPRLDTLVVSGGWGTREAIHHPALLAFVREQARKARRVCSVCSGAYVLAEAGLLDGRRATTHWRRSQHFAAAYPAVRLEADRIFVRDGSIWTSAGITAGIDLSLALISEDLGEEVSRQAAQELVIYHRRPGGQSQFSALLDLDRPEGRFAALLDWMRAHLSQPLTVDRLAGEACMSPRNFTRAFTAETGVSPARAVERLRLEAARGQVEQTHQPINVIAAETGFGDPERMRRAFVRAFGQPPQALRRIARQP